MRTEEEIRNLLRISHLANSMDRYDIGYIDALEFVLSNGSLVE